MDDPTEPHQVVATDPSADRPLPLPITARSTEHPWEEPPLLLQDLPKGPAPDVLHDDVVGVVIRPRVVHRDDARVVHAGRGLGLPAEPGDEGLVAGRE